METEFGRGPSRGARWLRVVVLIAFILIVIAAIAYWVLLRPTPGRDPVEFLPASTQAAVCCDMRPNSPGTRLALREWGYSDVRHLGGRAAELAQKVVDWSGFELDVKKDLIPWFGGELVVASVSHEGRHLYSPSSGILIARTRSMRRAVRSLEQGVKPFARDADWRRTTQKRSGEKVTVWLDGKNNPRLAYLAKDGCLLVSKSAEVIEQCLLAAQRPRERLSYTDEFNESVGDLAREVIAWAYLNTDWVVQGSKRLVPGVLGGWPGLWKAYWGNGLQRGIGREDNSGVIAVGLKPTREGAELRALYRRPGQRAVGGSAKALNHVASVLPREAVFYAVLHQPGEWLEAQLPGEEAAQGVLSFVGRSLPIPASLSSWLGFEQPPTDVLFAVLPPSGRDHAALAVAAPKGQLPVPPRGLLSLLFPKPSSAIINDVAVLATDEQTVKQCALAAKKPTPVADGQGDVRFVVAARPAGLSRELTHFQEIKVVGRSKPGGGEGEIRIAVPPRYLLGGR